MGEPTPFNLARALELVAANARQAAICGHYAERDDEMLAEGRMLGAADAIRAEFARLTVLEQENAELRERLRPEDSRPLSTDPDSSPDWCGCCDAWTCPIHRPSETTAP